MSTPARSTSRRSTPEAGARAPVRARPGPYGAALVLALAAIALTILLRPWLAPNPFMPLLTAVGVSALYGGLGPGLLAALICVAGSAGFFLVAEDRSVL